MKPVSGALGDLYPGAYCMRIKQYDFCGDELVAKFTTREPLSTGALKRSANANPRDGYPILVERDRTILGRFSLTLGEPAYRVSGKVDMRSALHCFRDAEDLKLNLVFNKVLGKTKNDNGAELMTEVRVMALGLSYLDISEREKERGLVGAAMSHIDKSAACNDSLVYFIKTKYLETVKIGTTRSISKRLKALATGSPEPLIVLATVPGSFVLESMLHSMFHEDRITGEWFNYSSAIKHVISLILKRQRSKRA